MERDAMYTGMCLDKTERKIDHNYRLQRHTKREVGWRRGGVGEGNTQGNEADDHTDTGSGENQLSENGQPKRFSRYKPTLHAASQETITRARSVTPGTSFRT